jgi:hypothetical protein
MLAGHGVKGATAGRRYGKLGGADIVGMGNRILTQKKQSSIQKSL